MNEKLKILFCIENFKHGGIPKALESMLELMDQNRFEVHIFCINQEKGPYKKVLQKYVDSSQNWLLWAFTTYYTDHKGIVKCLLLLVKLFRKFLIRTARIDLFRLVLEREAYKLSGRHYDIVVAYAEGTITHFVTQIKCENRIAWIHMDYKRILDYIHHINEIDIYRQYHHIVIPSQFSKRSFVEVYPYLSDRTKAIPNLMNADSIKKMSRDEHDLDDRFFTDRFTLLSVGRICYEKRFFEIPRIASELKQRGCNFKWYIIGDGSKVETTILEKNITNEALEDMVILLGAKKNPYPYIRRSNLLIVTSLSETFSYVIGEAKILGVPVVSTNFGTVKEVLNANYGMISELDDMADAINNLMRDKIHYDKLKINLSNYKYENCSILTEIYSLFEKTV